jgi:dTDP-4-dehydrorhamnose reductase
MLAEVSAQCLARGTDYLQERAGLYHLAGDGFASRFDWAQLILALDHHNQEYSVKNILPALTSEFPTLAQRPLFSALDCENFSAAFELRLPAWKESLRLAMGA